MNLKKLNMGDVQSGTESRLFATFWDDGLLDLLSGMALLLSGLGWQTALGVLAVLQAPLWLLAWPPLRRLLIEPRAGFVEFSRTRRARNRTHLMAVLALGLGALILLALAASRAGAPDVSPGTAEPVAGLPATLLTVPAILAALLTGARRFYLYGLLLLAGAATAGILNLNPGIPIAVAGAMMMAVGGLLLLHFNRESREGGAA
jgi:hypothetical protein